VPSFSLTRFPHFANLSRTQLSFGLLLLAATAIRVIAYGGFTIGDDTIYIQQIIDYCFGGDIKPLHTHWATRPVMTVPPAIMFAIFGMYKVFLFTIPMISSLLKLVLTFSVTKQVSTIKSAWIATIIAATFPVEVIYAGQYFPDAISGLLEATCLVAWYAACSTGKYQYAIVAALTALASYLTRETIVHAWPLFAIAWLISGKRSYSAIAISGSIVAFGILCELFYYYEITGDPLYRITAILKQQQDPANPAFNPIESEGAAYYLFPIRVLLGSHEFGFTMPLAILASLFQLRNAKTRVLALWLIVGFIWLYYGSTVPHRWALMQRDPRYALALTVPACACLAIQICAMPRSWTPLLVSAIAIGNLSFVAMDRAYTILHAHNQLVEISLPGRVGLQPNDYLGVYWVSDFAPPDNYRWLSDVGGKNWRNLPNSHQRLLEESDIVVCSSESGRELMKRAEELGFRKIKELNSPPPLFRHALLRSVDWLRGKKRDESEYSVYRLAIYSR
jgi:hypothetical protein